MLQGTLPCLYLQVHSYTVPALSGARGVASVLFFRQEE